VQRDHQPDESVELVACSESRTQPFVGESETAPIGLRLSRTWIRAVPLIETQAPGNPVPMNTSYAVKWREPSGQTFLGRLELGPSAFVLEGRDGAEDAVWRSIAFEDVERFQLAQSAGDRLDHQATLVVVHAGGDVLVTSALVQAGVLHELVHRLCELRLESVNPAPVVVPLLDDTG
jgi:hypothetical protein